MASADEFDLSPLAALLSGCHESLGTPDPIAAIFCLSPAFNLANYDFVEHVSESEIETWLSGLLESLEALTSLETYSDRRFPVTRHMVRDALRDLRGRATELATRSRMQVYSVKVPLLASVQGVNCIGRLLGPGGQNIRRLEQDFRCTVRVRGRGSVKDARLEASLTGQPGYEHLAEPLHVLLEAEGPTAETQVRACLAAIQQHLSGSSRLSAPAVVS